MWKLVSMMKSTTTPSRDFAIEVVKTLKRNGFQAFWAGGCVRDLLLGCEPNDYDVATDARPDQVKPLFRKSCEVGMSFGVLRVLGPGSAGDVEVATFRSDGEYLDGRRPETVRYSTPQDDAARRDFTINGMFFDPITSNLFDFVGGEADLQQRVLRAIGEPAERFQEDKLRLLRAARFASRFNLTVEPRTKDAIRAVAMSIRVVSPERIAQEFRKMLIHSSRAEAMRLCRELGLIEAIFPPVHPLESEISESFQEPSEQVSFKVLRALPDELEFPIAMAALWLDLNDFRNEDPFTSSKSTSLELDETGKKEIEEIGRRLRWSNMEIDKVGWLVSRRSVLNKPKRLSEAALKRLLSDPWVGDLLTLHRAIAVANHLETSHIDYCRAYLEDQPRGPIDPPALVSGDDLRLAGLKPGPMFAVYLRDVRSAQLDRLIGSKRQALEWLARRVLNQTGERLPIDLLAVGGRS